MTRYLHLMNRLTYANITATLALFLSLGGASYAALVLPANSVGTRQIRSNAVTPTALSFPLGVVGSTDSSPENLQRTECNGGLAITGTSAPPCPPPVHGGTTPGREVHLYLHASASLLASAIVGIQNGSEPQTAAARVTLCVDVDHNCVAESHVTISGGQMLQVPVQALRTVSSGSHTAGLEVEAGYSSPGNGNVLVSSTSLIATALPGAAQKAG